MAGGNGNERHSLATVRALDTEKIRVRMNSGLFIYRLKGRYLCLQEKRTRGVYFISNDQKVSKCCCNWAPSAGCSTFLIVKQFMRSCLVLWFACLTPLPPLNICCCCCNERSSGGRQTATGLFVGSLLPGATYSVSGQSAWGSATTVRVGPRASAGDLIQPKASMK